MAILIPGVFAVEITRLHHAGRAIEVVHVVVIELAVGVVPQLVIGVHHGLVIVEHFQVHAQVFAEHVHRRADIFGERRGQVVDIHPDETAVADVRAHFPETRVGRAITFLIALLAARNIGTGTLGIETPRVENAGDALRVADRVIQKRVAAMRADIVETAHLHIFATDHEQLGPARVMESAVIKRVGDLALVAGDDPGLVEYFFLLFAKQIVFGIDARIDEMRFGKVGFFVPLIASSSHCGSLRRNH